MGPAEVDEKIACPRIGGGSRTSMRQAGGEECPPLASLRDCELPYALWKLFPIYNFLMEYIYESEVEISKNYR
jgi:hypothetical protein